MPVQCSSESFGAPRFDGAVMVHSPAVCFYEKSIIRVGRRALSKNEHDNLIASVEPHGHIAGYLARRYQLTVYEEAPWQTLLQVSTSHCLPIRFGN